MQLDLRERAVKMVRGSLLLSGPCYDLDLWDCSVVMVKEFCEIHVQVAFIVGRGWDTSLLTLY